MQCDGLVVLFVTAVIPCSAWGEKYEVRCYIPNCALKDREKICQEFLVDTPAHLCHFELHVQDFPPVIHHLHLLLFPSLWSYRATRGLLFHYGRKGNAIFIMIILFIDITASEEPESPQGWLLRLSSCSLFRGIFFHLRECRPLPPLLLPPT